MGLGNGKKNAGNQGSNFSYELKSLLQLQNIANTLSGSLPPGGVATEATLQAVSNTLLNLLAENKLDFELKSVVDTVTGDVYQLRGTLDEETGIFSWDYIDATGAVVVPANPVRFLNPDGLLTAIETELLNIGITLDAIQVEQLAQGLSLDLIVTNTLNTANGITAANVSLNDIENELIALNNTAGTLATQATLNALLTAFNAEDFATETTLDAQASDVAKLVGFAIGEYDEIDVTYIAAGNGAGEVGTVVYSFAAAPVATLTLTYDASNRLINVIKS